MMYKIIVAYSRGLCVHSFVHYFSHDLLILLRHYFQHGLRARLLNLSCYHIFVQELIGLIEVENNIEFADVAKVPEI